MRPYWKGYLKLALVSCPIALHAACSRWRRRAVGVGLSVPFREVTFSAS
jgi:hypothetical protein